ncbi:hypothetical protein TEA_007118 [Camellia sinensis var. sinensis]|uniref:Protein kinase domain-containing protein n=1 Tax=Camellia sinensis var. sinensis TaxID=542762 RepID=A0A4S4ECN8_CAMSN|nr:hypothetical protein TEA_007118 [Camellia sinensis var. sinensis]
MLGLAETSISGFLPPSLGLLKNLQTIAIYTALLSGQIPPELGDCTALQNIYLYENSLTGSIPSSLGKLKNLQNLLLWQNSLVGIIPPEIGYCTRLLLIDFSMNSLTRNIPETLGNLTSLQEIQLSVNQISGEIPTQLGNCRSLTHVELDNNQITGTIPSEFGNLRNLSILFLWQNRLEGNIPSSLSLCSNLEGIDLSQNALMGSIPKGLFEFLKLNKLLLLSNNFSDEILPEIEQCSLLIRFLDLGSNRLTGVIPVEISGCRNLTFLDLHSNSIAGNLPEDLNQLVSLQFVDVSDNLIEGMLSPSLESLSLLTKLVLTKNRLSGPIPPQIDSCWKLHWNTLFGEIPADFTALDKLGILDLSHNQLSDDLRYLADLQNLVVLNVLHNNFSERVSDTSFFAKLSLSVLAGNQGLCFSGDQCVAVKGSSSTSHAIRVAMVVLLCAACALLVAALYITLGGKMRSRRRAHDDDIDGDDDDDVEIGPPWEVTLYQKLNLSIADVAKCLTAGNVIERGRSGVIYKANIPSGLTIVVKRFRSSEKFWASGFSSEIATLARIRHRNIVRLLGWGANRKTKLLFYDYLPNGTLGALLHDGGGGGRGGGGGMVVQWETQLKIALGVAEGLAYLHHDCVPVILHRDVKAQNILLGERYETCLADFGLARLVEDEHGSFSANPPQFAGSYDYFAPEVHRSTSRLPGRLTNRSTGSSDYATGLNCDGFELVELMGLNWSVA